MRKLIAPLVLSAAAALVLSACGGSTTSETGSSAAPAASSAAAAGESAAAASGEPIVIGVVLPQTGPVALNVEQMLNVIKMRVDEANAAGGVAGRPIEIKTYDSKAEPETAAKEAQRAISQDGAAAIIGPYTTSEALAVAEVAERAKVVAMGSSAATPAITEGKQFNFRVAPLSPDLATGMMQMAKSLGATSGALLYDSGGFGLGALPLIEEAAKVEGVELTAVEYPINASDVTAQVGKAKSANPGAVFVAGSAGADYGLIAKSMAEQGLNVPLIGFSPITVPDAVKIAGSAYDTLPGVYTLQTIDPTKPQYQELVADYSAAYGDTPQLSEQVTQTDDVLSFILEGLAATNGEGGEALAQALRALPAREGAAGAAGSNQQFTADSNDAFKGQYLVPFKVIDGVATADSSVSLS